MQLIECLRDIEERMAKRRGVLITYDNGYCLKFVNELVLWLLPIYQGIYFR